MAQTTPIVKGLSLTTGVNVNRLNFEHMGKQAIVDLQVALRYSGPIVREAVFGWCDNHTVPQVLPQDFIEAVAKRAEALNQAYPFCDDQFYQLQDHYRLQMDHIGTAAMAYLLQSREEAEKDGSK